MKYRTMIELICDASDKEEAFNIAGDYLKGEVDFGVQMRCKTASLWAHKAKKYTALCFIAGLVFSSLVLKVTPIGGDEKIQSSAQLGFRNTCTIMPALKTKHKADFKKEWEKKKEEAVIDFLKK